MKKKCRFNLVDNKIEVKNEYNKQPCVFINFEKLMRFAREGAATKKEKNKERKL